MSGWAAKIGGPALEYSPSLRVPYRVVALALLVFSLLLFLPGLGAVHLFDWDEINFAEIAREMVVTGDYGRPQIGFAPFYEKPPLFAWLQALCFRLFGTSEWAARLPNALCGVLTLQLLLVWGKRQQSTRFGLWWAALYAGSLLPQLYFHSGIIDPWFNLFTFAALWGLLHGGSALRSGVWLGAAILTKGPVAAGLLFLIFALVPFVNRRQNPFHPRRILLFYLGAALLPLLWFGYEYLAHGPTFIEEFIRYQIRLLTTEDAGHGGFPGYHFAVLLLGCFPASLLALGRWRTAQFTEQVMWLLLAVVLVVFSLVQSKIVHYSSLAYFPITYLAARYVYGLGERKLPTLLAVSLTAVGLLWSLAALALPYLGSHPELLRELLQHDPFALANLEAAVEWHPWDYGVGGVLLVALAVFHWQWRRGRNQRALASLLVGTTLYSLVLLLAFAPRIEAYSQRAAIDFYKSLQDRPVYVRAVGFKSYAPYFYARYRPAPDPRHRDLDWLLHGTVDRPTYLVTKINKRERLDTLPQLRALTSRNGFVLYERVR